MMCNGVCNRRLASILPALLCVTVSLAGTSAAHAAPPAAIEIAAPRVVKIFGAGGIKGLYAYSTGFLVSAEGHIATVWSHVLDGESVTVVLHDGRRFEGKVLGAEPQLDLAVLKIDAEDLPHFDLDDAMTASAGTRVLGFSNMFKVATGDEPVSVLHGVVAAKTQLAARRGAFDVPYTGSVYVVDAITNNPGAGGGVLTTPDGVLLGMIGKELRNTQTNTWINYAIPIGEIKTVIREIISGRFVARSDAPDETRPNRYSPVDFGLVMVPDVLFRTPAYVDTIIPDSAASHAELRPNDLILFANDELIISCRAFRDVLGRQEAGDVLKLVVRRGNNLLSVELPVKKKPAGDATPTNRRETDTDDE